MKTVAEFEIQYHQFLDAEGKAVGPLPDFAKDPAELLKMYRLMTLVRAFDTKCVNLQRTGKLGTYASCLGHEATHVGVGAAMRQDDVLAPITQMDREAVDRVVRILLGRATEIGPAHTP